MTALPLADLTTVRATFDALQRHARDAGVVLRDPPPEPVGCCGRGCNGCVWEGFYAAATWWRDDALQQLGG